MDAGFPYRIAGGVCDMRVYSGTVGLDFAGNIVSDSVLTPALVTFTRNLPALMPSALPLWQYLHGATFTIDDRDGIFANAWIDHPSTDPVLGPCAADGTHELLNNMLIYNGQVLLNGRNF